MYERKINDGHFTVEEDRGTIRLSYNSKDEKEYADIYLREENGTLYLDFYGRDEENPEYCVGEGHLNKDALSIMDVPNGINVVYEDVELIFRREPIKDNIVAEVFYDGYSEEFKLVDHGKSIKKNNSRNPYRKEREEDRVEEYNGPFRWLTEL